MGKEELQGYNDGIKQNLSDCQKKRIQRGLDNGMGNEQRDKGDLGWKLLEFHNGRKKYMKVPVYI